MPRLTLSGSHVTDDDKPKWRAKMRDDTADPHARSHEGDHGDFAVIWADRGDWTEPNKYGIPVDNTQGWYVSVAGTKRGGMFGPFETSQAAFGAGKDAIDAILAEESTRAALRQKK